MADSFLFFLAYNFLRQRRLRGHTIAKGRPAKALPTLDELGVGIAAGAFSKFFTTPISNIVTRKQITGMPTSHARSKTSPKPAVTVASIAHDIYTTRGLQGFWSGYSATLILTLNPSLTFLFYNTLKRVLLRHSTPGARVTFLLAAISKAIASTITYPFSLAKTRSQAAVKRQLPQPKSVFGSLRAIAQTQGLSALYEGVSGEVIKGFLSNGTTMMLKQLIHRFIVQAYYIVLKLSQQFAASKVVERAGDVVKSAAWQAREGIEKMSEGARDALMDLGDEVEEVAYAMDEDANDVLWGMVDGAGELKREVVEILGGRKRGKTEGNK
jgi:Mitochondrial carrier protein